MKTESQTNKATLLIKEFLFKKGIYARRHGVAAGSAEYTNKKGDTKSRYFQAGISGGSDLFAFLPPNGRFLGIEIKKGADYLKPDQIGFIKNIEHMGCFSIVAKGNTAEEIFDDFKVKFEKLSTD